MRNVIFRNTMIFAVIVILLLTTSSVTATNQLNFLIKTSTESYTYYNYQNMTDFLHDLKANYSEIMSLKSIGTTYEGRDIWMVKLSDNVQVDEEETEVLLMGAHHGNEKPSFEVPIYFIKYV